MRRLTRRGFLTIGSIGIAFAGAVVAAPGVSSAMKLRTAAFRSARSASAGGALVAHVRDLSTGEIALLLGSNRLIVHDPDLADRIHAAARPNALGGN